MPEPTNPKKKSLMPSTPLRRALRGHGHALKPIVQVGKEGTTPAIRKQVQQALFDHELVKIKIGTECPESRFEVAEKLDDDAGVQIVQILGRTILAYKRHPEKPRYEGARARAAAGDPDAQPARPKRKGHGAARGGRTRR